MRDCSGSRSASRTLILGESGFHPCNPLSINGQLSFYVSSRLHSISRFSPAMALGPSGPSPNTGALLGNHCRNSLNGSRIEQEQAEGAETDRGENRLADQAIQAPNGEPCVASEKASPRLFRPPFSLLAPVPFAWLATGYGPPGRVDLWWTALTSQAEALGSGGDIGGLRSCHVFIQG